MPRRRPARADRARERSGTSSATSPTSPAAGEIVLLDRSWYNRAGLHRVGLGGSWRDALSLVIIVSVLDNTIASHNAVVRIQYGRGERGRHCPCSGAPARSGAPPSWRSSPRRRCPVLVTLIMGGVWDPTSAFGFVGFTNALAGAVAFMMILAAAMVFFHKVEPEKGWVRNLLLPAVGIAILLPAVYTAFYPNPGPTAKWARRG